MNPHGLARSIKVASPGWSGGCPPLGGETAAQPGRGGGGTTALRRSDRSCMPKNAATHNTVGPSAGSRNLLCKGAGRGVIPKRTRRNCPAGVRSRSRSRSLLRSFPMAERDLGAEVALGPGEDPRRERARARAPTRCFLLLLVLVLVLFWNTDPARGSTHEVALGKRDLPLARLGTRDRLPWH